MPIPFFRDRTPRSRATRLHIAQTLLQLLKKSPLEMITTTKLIQESHVSRMTFYKYFIRKEDVLTDYLYELVNAYRIDRGAHPEIHELFDYHAVCHCLHYFAQHWEAALTMIRSGMTGMMLQAVNDYVDAYVIPESKHHPMALYAYAGALCNAYIRWIQDPQNRTPEEIAQILCAKVSFLSSDTSYPRK